MAAFFLHGTLSILGLSIILMNSAMAFALVKYIGAAYLCWIGFKALLAAIKGVENTAKTAPAKRRRTMTRAFGEGFPDQRVEPQGVDVLPRGLPRSSSPQARPPPASAFLLVALHSAINAIWFAAMVLLFSPPYRCRRQRQLPALAEGG